MYVYFTVSANKGSFTDRRGIMFLMKSKKHSNGNILMGAANTMLGATMTGGMRYAEKQLDQAIKAIEKHQGLNYLNKSIKRHPAEGIVAVAGIGLAIFGISRLFRR